MKKIYFSLLFITVFTFVKSQCTPSSNYADSTFGAWPDTTTNFPDAISGVMYSTDLNFKVPTDAGDIIPALAGTTIVNFTVDSVVGLNQGYSYSCNISNCTFQGGANGCAQISGIATELGTSNITIHITANLQTFLGSIPFPYSFAGYHITVNQNTASLINIKNNSTKVFPNPANEFLEIQNLNAYKNYDIYSISGEKLISISNTTTSKIDVSYLSKGIYFLHLNANDSIEIIKFIKE